ncbi:MAG: hypothetical protein F9K19_16615 [Rhizobiaceae bacterium]|nr:MAG: hypothetical protein F9K19_16615 [Rhizobiaceae bacterium]CAG0979409.1 hypothetical protein RHIZO_01652 [Rhizobiaceae bacterium]
MRMREPRLGWLAALRRDRFLFAVTGALILIASYLQPLAEANAAGTGHAWIICTEFGAVRSGPADPAGGVLPGADDCPKCVAGTCQPTPPFKAIADTADTGHLALPHADVAPRSAAGGTLPPEPRPGTHGIRAPPRPV